LYADVFFDAEVNIGKDKILLGKKEENK